MFYAPCSMLHGYETHISAEKIKKKKKTRIQKKNVHQDRPSSDQEKKSQRKKKTIRLKKHEAQFTDYEQNTKI